MRLPAMPPSGQVPRQAKARYITGLSATVRRLVRDGVDNPLASLFVHVARPAPADAEGTGRARSATEAFLFRRLETLTETAGRFRLNVELPIPFDGWGRMEVDLLCADAGIAVDIIST